MKSIIPLIFLFLLLLTLTHADSEYTQIGTDNQDFLLGNGDFQSDTNDTVINIGITVPKYLPLVSDLDGDGQDEIIITKDDDLVILQVDGSSITAIDTVTIPGVYSDPQIHDIDGDGLQEITFIKVVGGIDTNATHYNFNGTDLTVLNDLSCGTGNSGSVNEDATNVMTNCIGGQCVAVRYNENTGGALEFHYIYQYNTTTCQESPSLQFRFTHASDRIPCMSVMKVMPIITIGANTEYLWTALAHDSSDAGSGLNEFIDLKTYIINDTGEVAPGTIDTSRDLGNFLEGAADFNIGGTSGHICDAKETENGVTLKFTGNLISSPLVADVDSTSSGDEIIIAAAVDDTEFRLFAFENDGTFIDNAPSVDTLEGEYLSNVILADIFSDTGFVDLCVIAYEPSTNSANMLCWSLETSQSPDNVQFNNLNISALFNVTASDSVDWSRAIHAVNYDQTSKTLTFMSGSNDPSEILTSYGTLLPSGSGIDCSAFNLCSLEIDFSHGQGLSSVIGADIDTGNEEIIGLTTSTVYVLNDGFVNTNCDGTTQSCFDTILFNPAINTTWKQNTTSQIELTLSDVDGDNIAGRVIWYHNTSDARNTGWSANFSSGTKIVFNEVMNVTTNGAVLRVMARDTDDPTVTEIIDYSMTVSATSGIEFGEATTTITFDDVETVNLTVPTVTESIEGNIIDRSVSFTSENTGLSKTQSVLIIMIMASLLLYFTAGSELDKKNLIGLIAIVNVGIVALAVLENLLSFGIIIFIILVGIGVAAIWFRRAFTS